MLANFIPKSAVRFALLTSIGVVACGCVTDKMKTFSLSKSGRVVASAEKQITADDLEKKYRQFPTDKAVALAYTSALARTGRDDQAVAVIRRLTIAYPHDRQVLSVYGKTLAKAGQYEVALDAIRRAQTPDMPDWSLLSAEAAALDGLGRSREAQELFKQALKIAPKDGVVMSNLA
ncbi:pilus assembly protein TadD, partial [Ochrobactrum sp. MYb29]